MAVPKVLLALVAVAVVGTVIIVSTFTVVVTNSSLVITYGPAVESSEVSHDQRLVPATGRATSVVKTNLRTGSQATAGAEHDPHNTAAPTTPATAAAATTEHPPAAQQQAKQPATTPAAEQPATTPPAEQPATTPAAEQPAPTPAAEQPAPKPAAEPPAAATAPPAAEEQQPAQLPPPGAATAPPELPNSVRQDAQPLDVFAAHPCSEVQCRVVAFADADASTADARTFLQSLRNEFAGKVVVAGTSAPTDAVAAVLNEFGATIATVDASATLSTVCGGEWCWVVPLQGTYVQRDPFPLGSVDAMKGAGFMLGLSGRPPKVAHATNAPVAPWARRCGFSEAVVQRLQTQGTTFSMHGLVDDGGLLLGPTGASGVDALFPAAGGAAACLAAQWGPVGWVNAMLTGVLAEDAARATALTKAATVLSTTLLKTVPSEPKRSDVNGERALAVLDDHGSMVPWVVGYKGHAALEAAATRLSKPTVKVIAYGLYGGDQARYVDGAMENSFLAQQLFPTWVMRVYHDSTVPPDVLQLLRDRHVQLVDMTTSAVVNKMSWRFMAAADPTVRRFTARDIDSRLSYREKYAVEEWEQSGRLFHVLRDHPSHKVYAMSGGMWGGTFAAVPDMVEQITAYRAGNEYLADMNFLNGKVWNRATGSIIQHDSVGCQQYHGRPFPTLRAGMEHVGSVYLDGAMRQGDVNLLRTGYKPAACRSKGKQPPPAPQVPAAPRRELRAGFETAGAVMVTTVDAGNEFNQASFESVRAQCSRLDHGVWWDCKGDEAWVKAHQPCTKSAFIARIDNAYISDNRVHGDVPGTVFTNDAWFKWQVYVRGVPDGHPRDWRPRANIITANCFASVLQAYPNAPGHFPHEGLPRVLFLLQHIPQECSIIYATSDFVQRFIDLLPAKHRERMVPWAGAGTLYYARSVYVANEAPFCETPNPHNGGMSTYFMTPLMRHIKTQFPSRPTATVVDVLVIKRTGSRALVTHDALMGALRSRPNAGNVVEFTAAGSLQDHIDLFANAKVVIGPHGAGFSNLVFCSEGTRVVEIGWDGRHIMTMDNMYFRVSESLGLDYRLVLGSGQYTGSIRAPVEAILAAAFS